MAYASFDSDGITVESSIDTADQLAETLTPDPVVEVPDEAAPAEPAIPPVESKAKPRKDPQARVEQATAKEAAAKRERDEAKAESAALQARLDALEKPPAPRLVDKPAPVAGDPEPQEADFADYRQYVKAQARWEAKQEIQQQETARQQHEAQQQRAAQIHETNQQFGTKYSAILAEDPDFPTRIDPRLLTTPRVSVLADPSTATFGNFLVEQVFQSEHPKELLEHLSDPSVVQRLATLPPAQVIRDLAKFEGRLDAASPAAPVSKTPAISHAKAPIRPVVSSPVAADPNDVSDDLSVDEHIRRMNAKDRQARRAS